MNKPKVSIIIPCYNSERWIEQCLNSVLKQDYKNIEVICIDNESTDNSVELIEKTRADYAELIVGSAPNIYPHCWDEARSAGFEKMTGDYVLTMGSDDWVGESFITNCMKYINHAPHKILALQSPVKGVQEDREIYTGEIKYMYHSLDEFKRSSLGRCPVNTPTVIYNRKLYDDGLLDTKPEIYGGAADYDLYCRLADRGIFIYPAPQWLGFFYRWHAEQATWKVQKETKDYDKMIQEYWKKKWKI